MTNLTELAKELDLEEMPQGFRKVSVLLTETEYQNLRKVAAVTGEGTVGAAIRRALKWPETPYGLKAVLTQMIHQQREGK